LPFTKRALRRIYRYSRGIPRLLNAVCDKALLAGFVEQADQVDHNLVTQAIQELEGELDV
jgi:general secretion pathway protein A